MSLNPDPLVSIAVAVSSALGMACCIIRFLRGLRVRASVRLGTEIRSVQMAGSPVEGCIRGQEMKP